MQLRGPVTPSPAERELVRIEYRETKHCLQRARFCFESASTHKELGDCELSVDYLELATRWLVNAVYSRNRARHLLRMFSGLSADAPNAWGG